MQTSIAIMKWAARYLNPMNPEEKLHVVYEGERRYPGGNENFLVEMDGIMMTTVNIQDKFRKP